MRFYIFIFLLIFGLAGCKESSQEQPTLNTKPYIMNANNIKNDEQKLKEIDIKLKELESNKEIARINMERDINIEKIKSSTLLEQENIKKDLQLNEQALHVEQSSNEFVIQKYYLLAFIIGFVSLLVILYLMYKNYNRTKIKMHEDTIAKEKFLQENELKAQIAQKVIEKIADGNLNGEQEQKLIASLKEIK